MHYTPNHELQISDTPGVAEETQAMLRVWASVFRQGLQDWAAEQAGNVPARFVGAPKGEPTRWFNAQDNVPGSFVWLCDLFGIHPDRARAAARRKTPQLLRGVGQRWG